MARECLKESVRFCKGSWLKLTIIALLSAVLVSVFIVSRDRFLGDGDGDTRDVNIEKQFGNDFEQQDAAVPSQTVLSGSRGGLGKNFVKEPEGGDTGWELDVDAAESHERGVREVRDLPLMLLKHKLKHRERCLLNFCNLESEATRRVQGRKSFLYMRKLYLAMAVQTERADLMEDSSSADWAIRAYAPALRTRHSVMFKRAQDARCNVTRVELLIGFRCKDRAHEHADIIAVANGHSLRPSVGTFHIRKAAVFDLTAMAATPDLNITIKNRKCISATQVCHSMLFEFCNINDTVRNLFQENESKRSPDHQPSPGIPSLDIAKDAGDTTDPTQDQGKSPQKGEKNPSCVGCEPITQVETRTNNGDGQSEEIDRAEILRLSKMAQETVMREDPLLAERFRSGIKPIVIPALEKFRVAPAMSFPLPLHLPVSSASELLSSSSMSATPPTTLSSPPSSPSFFPASLSSSSPFLSSLPSASISLKPDEAGADDTRRVARSAPCEWPCPSTTRTPVRTCGRREMKIDLLTDLQYPVLMPDRPVDVGMCQGTCIHACHMGQVGDSVTAHAVLLNLLAGTQGAVTRWGPGIRMSSCVPKRMKTMSVLRVDSNDNASFRTEIVNWSNMIIDSCRCA
ncbi:hypothetical protein EGW08_009099 [Elysia chlorotica]|uniref:TGF-beta family profile domain-containing protein n=1 Tax=Elysia chlorotica TaxID=188477 RepID=A0A433TNJ0_ELYCH|nr:hypothetical protein EGW08_009099 [Elysia chlorotica]